MTSIEGLRALTAIGGYLYIRGNANLTSVEGLRHLKYIRGDVGGDAICLPANPKLARGLPFPALLGKNGKVDRGSASSPNNDYVKSHLAALDRIPNTCA